MNKFKKGDKVKCVNNIFFDGTKAGLLEFNKTYIIEKHNRVGIKVKEIDYLEFEPHMFRKIKTRNISNKQPSAQSKPTRITEGILPQKLYGIEPIELNKNKHPDPKLHKQISFFKSGVRILAGIFLVFGSTYPEYLFLSGVYFIIAEFIGVVEELV